VALEDLADIVCPSDPSGAETLSWAKAFFLVLEKQGWIWELGVLVVELLGFFEGLMVVEGWFEQELCSPRSQIRVTRCRRDVWVGSSLARGEAGTQPSVPAPRKQPGN